MGVVLRDLVSDTSSICYPVKGRLEPVLSRQLRAGFVALTPKGMFETGVIVEFDTFLLLDVI